MTPYERLLAHNAQWRDEMTDEEINAYFEAYCKIMNKINSLTGDEL